MADLDPLIRFRRYGLEEKQRVLGQLYQEAEQLHLRKKNLLDQLEHEKQVTQELGDIQSLTTFASYTERVKITIIELNAFIAEAERKVSEAQDAMREAFGDLKKIEITQRGRLEKLALENKRKEDNFLNDVALNIYRKRIEEDGA